MQESHGKVRRYLSRFQIDKNMMVFVNRMSISVRTASATLEVFSADETAIDVDVGEADGTEFLKVEVKSDAIYLVHT